MAPITSSVLASLLLPFLALSARIHITIPPTNHLANPASLPSTTRAVLSSKGVPLTVPLTRLNDFIFPEVPAGSHLLSVFSRDVIFENLRIDVDEKGGVEAWTTWRGNEWSNKGEVRGSVEPSKGEAVVQLRAVGVKKFYQERPSFSIMSIFSNPMILIAVLTLGLVVGMPYLMDNLDPETKAEFEEMQKKQKGMTSGATSLQSMDLANDFASWMAGSKPKSGASTEEKKSKR